MWTAIGTLAPTVAIVLGLIFAGIRWVGKMDQNTKATEKLTEAFQSFSDRIDDKVNDHEVRIRVLEAVNKVRAQIASEST